MIVYHVLVQAADDYLTRREKYRHAHIQRIGGLREMGVVIAGGPAADGKTAELFYRLQQPSQLKLIVEEDPYWLGGVWTGYTARTFGNFVEPWEAPPVVLDGSRKTTIVEVPTLDPDMAQFALIEMRGAGRIQLGGFLEDGATLALVKTADGAQAREWFAESGFWKMDALAARSFVYVL